MPEKRYDLAPLAPETAGHDLVIVVGWPWRMTVTLTDADRPLDLTTVGVACCFHSAAHRELFAQTDVAIDSAVPGRICFSLTETQTCCLHESPLEYEILSKAIADDQVRQWMRGRIDLLTPTEYYASIRRVRRTMTIDLRDWNARRQG